MFVFLGTLAIQNVENDQYWRPCVGSKKGTDVQDGLCRRTFSPGKGWSRFLILPIMDCIADTSGFSLAHVAVNQKIIDYETCPNHQDSRDIGKGK